MRTKLSRLHAWALALTATFTMAVSYVDRQTLAILAPTVQAELHISEQQYGFLVSGFSIAYLLFAPLSGQIIDRIGARRGLLGAVLVWSMVAALHALAPSFAVLFALRIALGIAEAPSFPGAAQTVHRALPEAERGRGFGILFSGGSFGAMLVPMLATYLEHRFGFRVAFLGTAVVGLCWVPLWLLVAYGGPARAALDEAPRPVRSEGALRGRSLLLQPVMARTALLVFASAPLLSLYFNWSAKYLVHDHGFKQSEVGAYLWFPPLFFDAGSILFGHLASKARAGGEPGVPRRLVAAAMMLAVVGAAVPFMGGPLSSMLMLSVSMAGGGGLYALTTTDLMARVSPEVVSTAGGLCASAQSVAYIVASPLIGWSVGATHGYTQIMVLLSAWVVPGCLGWLFWRSPEGPAPGVGESAEIEG